MQGRPQRHSIAHLPVHFVHRSLVHQGTNGGRGVHAVTRPQFFDALAQGIEEGRKDLALDENSVGADTGLPGIKELDQGDTPGGVDRVGIVEHNEGRVPPEFH